MVVVTGGVTVSLRDTMVAVVQLPKGSNFVTLDSAVFISCVYVYVSEIVKKKNDKFDHEIRSIYK